MSSVPELYLTLWDRCIIGLAEVNKDGYFIRANPAFCNLLGYSESELQKKKWHEITHPDDTVGGDIMFDKAVAGHITSYTMEKRYITKRGQIIWANLFVSTVLDDNKELKFLLKQIINAPIIIPAEGLLAKNTTNSNLKDIIKENYKLILASIAGVVFTIYGHYTSSIEIQNLGIALTLGIFGGVMAKK